MGLTKTDAEWSTQLEAAHTATRRDGLKHGTTRRMWRAVSAASAASISGSGCGKARILHTRFTEQAEQDAVIAEQRADRDVEYGEVVERTPAFLAEIAQETARGRATYAEVEESEADLERFEKWLTSISARDYFHAAGGQAARDAVQACRDAFTAFEAAALRVVD